MINRVSKQTQNVKPKLGAVLVGNAAGLQLVGWLSSDVDEVKVVAVVGCALGWPCTCEPVPIVGSGPAVERRLCLAVRAGHRGRNRSIAGALVELRV